jgi:hypothetical protein
MTLLQSTRKKALNLRLLSSQNMVLTQAYLPNSAVLEARGAQILGSKSLWQLSFFYGGALHFLVLRMEMASPFCHLEFWGGSCISGKFLNLRCKQSAIEDNTHFSVMLQQVYCNATTTATTTISSSGGGSSSHMPIISQANKIFMCFLHYLSHRSLLRV